MIPKVKQHRTFTNGHNLRVELDTTDGCIEQAHVFEMTPAQAKYFGSILARAGEDAELEQNGHSYEETVKDAMAALGKEELPHIFNHPLSESELKVIYVDSGLRAIERAVLALARKLDEAKA